MITVKEDTTLVGISEFRTNIEGILEESKKHKIVIGKRNKPVAVLLDMEKYSRMEHALEILEDFALGFLARERDSKTKSSDYVDIEKALQSIKGK
jgi:prevent-host-death family protein